MARVHYRKARKDYPENGIKAGDQYYYAKIKTGQRSSRTIRSLTKPKPSQLTTSSFKSGWYAAQEAWEEDQSPDTARSIAGDITALGEEAREAFDNMPEGLQQGDTGMMLEERADTAEQVASEIEQVADNWEVEDEPEEDEYEDEDEYQDAVSDYEDMVSNARSDITDLLDDMPD